MARTYKTVAVSFPPEMQEKIKEIAEKEMDSVSHIIQIAVRDYIKKYEKENDRPE